ncbi:hypothetical protein V498_08077, partial [Pseudogymnoascus sp. VKM F-4517 (FW-2822)]
MFRQSFAATLNTQIEPYDGIPLYTTCRLYPAAPATNVAKLATQQTSALPLSVSAITASNLDTNRTDDNRRDQFLASNGCPLPRTTEAKQCYSCSGIGHVQADCPTLRLAGTSGRCYSCGLPGHLARDCSAPPGVGGMAPG